MVLARLDFAPIFGFDNIASDFQKKFSDIFPESRIEHETGYDIDMTDFRDPKMHLRENHQTYALSNDPEKKKVKLSPSTLILEHHTYVDFETFFKEMASVGNYIFDEKKSVFSPTRLGIRKINSLIVDEVNNNSELKGYFDDRLTSYLQLPLINKSLNSDRHFLAFDLDDGKYQVNLQFSSERGKKNDKDSRRFILDIDVYSQSLPKEFSQCMSSLTEMNDIVFDIFWSLISDKTESFLMKDEE